MCANTFIFKKDDKIGVADAKADREVLLANFIDTGDYKVISDLSRTERFILGRAGAGKTALILKLMAQKDNVIVIEPESLSLGYISNSTMITRLTELGVDFDLFYRLLWRHVLGVEILKHHFGITDQKVQVNVLDKLKDKFKRSNKRNNHARAIDYLETWGSSFWMDTDYRIKELTTSMVAKLEGSLGLKHPIFDAIVKGDKSISEEQKVEVVKLCQEVVCGVQMKELADLMKMLDDAIDDKQKYYYLVIDRLDENWVDENIRYKLIKALVETVKDFEIVRQVKPMIVLRNDLISRVYDQTRTTGFQEEKYSTLNLHVVWNKEQLTRLLDTRISFLVKQRYTSKQVTHKDIFPSLIRGTPVLDYIFDRTLMRPRDVIAFINACINQAVDSPIITEDMLLKAEREYSRDRRSAIRDEWYADYSSLNFWDKILNNLEKEFFAADITESSVKNILQDRDLFEGYKKDKLWSLTTEYIEQKIDIERMKKRLLQVFFVVGYVGVDIFSDGDFMWSYQPKKFLQEEELNDDTIYKIHPCFYSCFKTIV